MNINWVSNGNDNLATHRWRVKLPAYGLAERPEFDCVIQQQGDPEAEVNVFQKHFNMQNDANFAINNQGKTKLVFDISDDHFDREAGPYYSFMCDKCDVITCPTARMQERVYECTGRLAQIVPDPLSFPRHGFKHAPDPRFLWFGNRVNITSIYKWINKVPNLTVVCNLEMDVAFPEHVNFIPWSPGVVEDLIDEHDIVLLPRNDYEWAKTKSPNRATDSLYAGRFVITDFEEVYGDLDEYVYLGEPEDGVQFYLENEDTVARMVETGQAFVAKEHSPEVVIDRWGEILKLSDERIS